MAQSDNPVVFDDRLCFGSTDLAGAPAPSPPPKNVVTSCVLPMAVDSSSKGDELSEKNRRSSGRSVKRLRSLSVDSGIVNDVRFKLADEKGKKVENRAHHLRHSNSMEGSNSVSFEIDSTGVTDGVKKAMDETLAQLSLSDPMRAKRIISNRRSAARSKERKILYSSELERKVQTLQTEATTLSAQVNTLQRDTAALTTENRQLILRLQALQHQDSLRDALNDTLREDVQLLKRVIGQIPPVMATFSTEVYVRSPHPSNNDQTRNGQPRRLQLQSPLVGSLNSGR